MIKKLEYTDDHELIILDQTLLPHNEKFLKLKDYKDVIQAISSLRVRGAPLIGIAAAYGIVLGVHNFKSDNLKNLEIHFYNLIQRFRTSRPTARNLFYALDRMTAVFMNQIASQSPSASQPGRDFLVEIENALLDEADKIFEEDIELCNRIAVNGSELITDEMNILTHCNTGELAAGGIGTAQGIITTAAKQAKRIFVYVDETRPLLQGARLTAYELEKNGIEYQILVDSLAGALMRDGMVDAVLIGADRIACNGDVINKVGSYSLAVNCARHNVPFYVAAPGTTIDFQLETGRSAVIEERPPDEVRTIRNVPISPRSANVFNPAFDLVPHELVSAIITEFKIHYPPYDFKSIEHVFLPPLPGGVEGRTV